ncbi:hypothetical protein NC653_004915 [Populus alba x Populus x berolinensis]|uniref:Amino acid transporter transmembrane domain-containing protein n=1 Tax=Populus alba x Populus x berolinensis TaxID=444605 RepID=A0AAD6RAL6_9ROSI|nr:hypothetical protein NC653_004915 [Populus alba x Populus x berolinensis]
MTEKLGIAAKDWGFCGERKENIEREKRHNKKRSRSIAAWSLIIAWDEITQGNSRFVNTLSEDFFGPNVQNAEESGNVIPKWTRCLRNKNQHGGGFAVLAGMAAASVANSGTLYLFCSHAHTKPNIFSASISSWLLTRGAFDEVGFKEKGMLVNWHGILTALSLYAFCYCAHPVFPTLYISMKNKRHSSNVMILALFYAPLANASMAVMGYLMFGPSVRSQITLNLPTEKLSSSYCKNPSLEFTMYRPDWRGKEHC